MKLVLRIMNKNIIIFIKKYVKFYKIKYLMEIKKTFISSTYIMCCSYKIKKCYYDIFRCVYLFIC